MGFGQKRGRGKWAASLYDTGWVRVRRVPYAMAQTMYTKTQNNKLHRGTQYQPYLPKYICILHKYAVKFKTYTHYFQEFWFSGHFVQKKFVSSACCVIFLSGKAGWDFTAKC